MEVNALLFAQAVLVTFLAAGVMMVVIWLYYRRQFKRRKQNDSNTSTVPKVR